MRGVQRRLELFFWMEHVLLGFRISSSSEDMLRADRYPSTFSDTFSDTCSVL
jgi:hypothetical protein